MTEAEIKRFDRMDENFTKPAAPDHVVVEVDMRGQLSLKNDRSKHRRYTSFYSDLQN